MKLYIGNLNEKIEDSHLLEAFSEFGKVQSAKIKMDRFTRRSACFGYVEMPNDAEAEVVIRKVNGGLWEGKKIIVKKAYDKK